MSFKNSSNVAMGTIKKNVTCCGAFLVATRRMPVSAAGYSRPFEACPERVVRSASTSCGCSSGIVRFDAGTLLWSGRQAAHAGSDPECFLRLSCNLDDDMQRRPKLDEYHVPE